MSSRKSDPSSPTPRPSSADPSAVPSRSPLERGEHAADPTTAPAAALPPEPTASSEYHEIIPPDRNPWLGFLLSNWAIPLALFGIVLLAGVIDNPRGMVDSQIRRIIYQVGVYIIAAVGLQLINGVSGQFSLGHAGFMAVGAFLSAYPLKEHSGARQDPVGLLLFYLSVLAVIIAAAIVLILLFRGIRLSGRVHPAIPGVLMLFLAAWVLGDIAGAAKRAGGDLPGHYVWSHGFRLLGQGYDYAINYAGKPAAALSALLPAGIRPQLSFLVALAGGGVFAAIAGLVVGLPTLRLRGDYLAIATLGFAEIIRVAFGNTEALGGALGLQVSYRASNFAWIYGCVLIAIVVVWRVTYSAKGRSIASVREDEIAAAAVGIDTTHHKVLAFVLGAFFAGIAGGLFAHFSYLIKADDFGFMQSVELVLIVTLGGLGSISGAIVTAILIAILPEVLRSVSERVSDYRMVIYSAILIAMMLLRPQGMLGHRELWPRRWTRRGRAVARAASSAPEVPA